MDFVLDKLLPWEFMPKTSYYFSLCNLCSKYIENMKSCSQCKSVVYCCKDHQVRDWKNHKGICKAIAITENNLRGCEVSNFHDFLNLQQQKRWMWLGILKRPLTQHESQMWMHPKVCAICYSNKATLICQGCLTVTYCSNKHQNQHKIFHKQHCHLLKFAMEHTTKFYYLEEELVIGPFDDNVEVLPDSFQEFLKLSHKSNNFRKAGVNAFVLAATILYGLEKAGLVINRAFKQKNLTVHIVGANENEGNCAWKFMCELPIHWLKNLETIHYYIIGPELGKTENTDKYTHQLCESCRTRNVKTHCFFRTDFYHNVANNIQNADLVVCFNSGIHEHRFTDDDPWRDSLKSLTANCNIPLILTAFNKYEIFKDVERVKVDGMVEEILAPQINPFHSPYPLREFDIENEPVYYGSFWISILRRKQLFQ